MDYNIFYALVITFIVILVSFVINKLSKDNVLKEKDLQEYKNIFDFVLNIIKDVDKKHFREIEEIMCVVDKCYSFVGNNFNMSELELEKYLYENVIKICKDKNIELNEFRTEIIKKIISLKLQNKSMTEILRILSSMQK